MSQNNAAQAAEQAIKAAIRKAYDDGYNDAKMAPDNCSTYCVERAVRLDSAALLSKLRATVADELVASLRRMASVAPASECEVLHAAANALASAPASEDGLTAKQAWWAGYRAGKGLPPDTPRQDAVKVDISSARLVTHWPNGTPRDERDTASDPEGKLIHDPTEPLLAASAPVAGEAYQGDNVAARLDTMADYQPPGSQAQSDLYAAATIWRKHIAHRAAPQASEAVLEAIQFVLKNFKASEAQGYHTRDRQFAISILEQALSAQPGAQKEQSDGNQ